MPEIPAVGACSCDAEAAAAASSCSQHARLLPLPSADAAAHPERLVAALSERAAAEVTTAHGAPTTDGINAVPATDTHTTPPPPAAALPWHRRPAVRWFLARVALRVVVVAVVVVLLREFPGPFHTAGDAYLGWIHSLGPAGGPAAFWFVACLFCAVSPTGYLPAVVAGATFDLAAAIPIAYTSVLLGAALNTLLVRGLLFRSAYLKRRCGRRAGAVMGGLERALLTHPVRMVTLLRLPFVGNGVLNYILSLSGVPAVPMLVGDAIGLAPGALLFTVAGGQVRSLASIVADGGGSPTAIGVLVGVSVAVVVSFVDVLLISRRVARVERGRLAAEEIAAAMSGRTVFDGVDGAVPAMPGVVTTTASLGEDDATMTSAAAGDHVVTSACDTVEPAGDAVAGVHSAVEAAGVDGALAAPALGRDGGVAALSHH